MTCRPLNFLRRFRSDQDGNMMIEFVIFVPLLFTIFMTSVELGIYSMRQMWLDRGLDMTVRLVRLGTGATPDHDALKDMICERAGFIPDCSTSLKLEMQPVDPRNFTGIATPIDCVDKSQPVLPEDAPTEPRPCSRTLGYFTPVHERGTEWDNSDGNTQTIIKRRQWNDFMSLVRRKAALPRSLGLRARS